MMMRLFLIGLFFVGALHAKEFLDLPEVEKKVLEENFFLLETEELLDSAKSQKWQAFSQYLPSLSYQASARRVEETSLFFSQKESYSSRFSLRQLLVSPESFFKIREKGKEAKALYFALLSQANALLTQARTAYYQVILAKEEIGVQKEELRLLKWRFDQEQLRFDQGVVTSFELLQTEVAFLQAQARLTEVENAYEQALLSLAELLSQKGDSLEPKEEKLSFERYPFIVSQLKRLSQTKKLFSHEDKETFFQKALEYSPVLAEQKERVEVLRSLLYGAKGSYFPSLQAELAYASPEGSSKKFSELSYGFEGALKLSWNLFDSFGREAKVSSVRHLLSKEKAELSRLRLHTRQAVLSKLADFESSALRLLATQKALSLAQENVRQAKERAEEGVITTLDYFEVIKAQKSAKLVYYKTSFALLHAYFSLQEEIGENLPLIKQQALNEY